MRVFTYISEWLRAGRDLFIAVLIVLPILLGFDFTLDYFSPTTCPPVMPYGSSVYFSDEFLLISSAITIDPVTQLILTFHQPAASKYYFPQALKNSIETLEYAVERAIWTEASVMVHHFPLWFPAEEKEEERIVWQTGRRFRKRPSHEPVAITNHWDVKGRRMLVNNWFVKKGDSTEMPRDDIMQHGAAVKVLWMDFETVVKKASFAMDRMILKKVIEAFKESEGRSQEKEAAKKLREARMADELEEATRATGAFTFTPPETKATTAAEHEKARPEL